MCFRAGNYLAVPNSPPRFNIVLHVASEQYYADVMSEEAVASWHFESQAATWEGYRGVSFAEPQLLGRNITELRFRHHGFEVPALGFGTCYLKGMDLYDAALAALRAGYRLIDTAAAYDNEDAVGAAIDASGINRQELFITSKSWPLGRDYVISNVRRTLENLGTDYIDLYLLHSPFVAEATGENNSTIRTTRHETWRAMEELHKQGILRNLGVANFGINQLRALRAVAKVQPTLNQIEFHAFHQDNELIRYCWKHDITVQVYGSVGAGIVHLSSGVRPIDDPVVAEIAQKHRVSPPQVLLRFALQRRVASITKASSESRMAQNLDVLSFSLHAQDLRELMALDRRQPLYPTHYPHYP